MANYIIALDQGTTSSRALLIDAEGKIKGVAQKEFPQIYPKPGWVEHDANTILSSQLEVLNKLITDNGIKPEEIMALGITNQRETTVIWDKNTGTPVYNAIVWQDKRTASICEDLKRKGFEKYIQKTTGLVVDSYFSATKIKWILDHVDGAREKAEKGDLLFGTIDSWLVWNLTKEKVHATDYSNASRTMLYNIVNLEWDQRILEELNIPQSILPGVKPSTSLFGNFLFEGVDIPIAGIAGDQQAALFGQACFKKGMTKNTYGTGCFMLMNTGKNPQFSKKGLLTTIAWGIRDEIFYALEGSVFIAGAAIQWLRDELDFFESAADSENLASQIDTENPVYVVPAFAGLGAPYWDMYARGAVFGLTRDTGKAHITRATLESLAYRTKDVLDVMQEESGIKLEQLKVDGGASSNNLLLQFQASILNTEVFRPEIIESTAMGAAFLAGITVGLWSEKDLEEFQGKGSVFNPEFPKEKREKLYDGWQKAVERTLKWDTPYDS